MIKVLHVMQNDFSVNGGIEKVVLNQIKYSQDMRFDLVIHPKEGFDPANDLRIDSVNLHYFEHRIRLNKKKPLWSWRNLNKYNKEWKRFLAQHSYDMIVVHCTDFQKSLIVKAVKKYCGHAMVIAHAHNTIIPDLWRNQFAKKTYLRYADRFFGCSLLSLKTNFDLEPDQKRCFLIRNAIDTEQYRFNPLIRQQIRRHYGIDDQTLVIGNVGRLCNEKNHAFMFEILKQIKNRKIPFKMLLIGEGELHNELVRQAEEMDLADEVIFLGIQEEIPSFLFAMDAFLFPSLLEGLGLALIEAQAAGLPCIVSDTVPEESAVSDQIYFLSLKEAPQTWATLLLEKAKTTKPRERYSTVVSENGYDIRMEAARVQSIYENLSVSTKIEPATNSL